MAKRSVITEMRVLTESVSDQMIRILADERALPDVPERYFNVGPGARMVPLAKLLSTKVEPRSITNAAKIMGKAYAGSAKRRDPIKVKENPDGSFSILDGNSTFNVAKRMGWKALPVEISVEEAAYPPGTIRKWKTGAMIKTRSGEWAPYQAGSSHVTSKAPDTAHPNPNLMSELAELASKGQLPKDVTPEQHLKIAEKVLDKQQAQFAKTLDTLKELAVGDGTAVMGRVKEVESALGKLLRKPKYGTAEGLQDGTGFRFVCENVDDLLATVAKVKERYPVSPKDEEDYISKPKDGYRSYHLIIKDDDGYDKEVQIRTPSQDVWANWCHDIYKPQNAAQVEAVSSAKNEILEYGKRMSDYYLAKDSGETPPDPPPCPPVVKKVFGCLPEQMD